MASEIKSKVRAIRKLFIVDKNSWDSLIKILIGLEWDIEVLHNLILINNSNLLTLRNKALIERNSPDIIINLSTASNEAIESFFETNTVSYSENIIEKFKTSILNFDIEPAKISQCYGGIPEKIYATNNKSLSPLNLANIINFGFAKRISNEPLSHSIFKSVEIKKIRTISNFFSLINKDFNKLNEITKWIDFGIQKYDSYEISYNPHKYFNLSTNYIFIFSHENFEELLYFWNTRAANSQSSLIWIPEKFLEKYIDLLNDSSEIMCFASNIESKLKSRKIKNPIHLLNVKELYFHSSYSRWHCFEHSQHVEHFDDCLKIKHPINKTFCRSTVYRQPCILEVWGKDELYYSTRRCLGELYISKYAYANRDDNYIKVNKTGISKFIIPHNYNDYFHELIKLPDFESVIKQLLSFKDFEFSSTNKSKLVNEIVGLVGGIQNVHILCQKEIFFLIRTLSNTTRKDHIIKGILKNIEDNESSVDIEEKLRNLLSDLENNQMIGHNYIIQTMTEIKSQLTSQDYLNKLQPLYDKNILIRGKSFECNHCYARIWLPLVEIRRKNFCLECNNEIHLPISNGNSFDTDFYKLNQLIARASDQGQISTLLVINYFFNQANYYFHYKTNLDIKKNNENQTDIDIVIKLNHLIGIGEVKTFGQFDSKQVTEIIKLSKEMKCDFIFFSSLSKFNSDEYNSLNKHLEKCDLGIPIFIFTEESFFDTKRSIFDIYFHNVDETSFIKPIHISNNI